MNKHDRATTYRTFGEDLSRGNGEDYSRLESRLAKMIDTAPPGSPERARLLEARAQVRAAATAISNAIKQIKVAEQAAADALEVPKVFQQA